MVHFFIILGCIDLDECPDVASKYDVDVSATSLQVPTVILFINEKEHKRLPDVSQSKEGGSLVLWDRTEVYYLINFSNL